MGEESIPKLTSHFEYFCIIISGWEYESFLSLDLALRWRKETVFHVQRDSHVNVFTLRVSALKTNFKIMHT